MGGDGHTAHETVQSVFHSMIEEKGVLKAFAKLLPDEAWKKESPVHEGPQLNFSPFEAEVTNF